MGQLGATTLLLAGAWHHGSDLRGWPLAFFRGPFGATASSPERANILSAVARTTILTFVRALCLDTVK